MRCRLIALCFSLLAVGASAQEDAPGPTREQTLAELVAIEDPGARKQAIATAAKDTSTEDWLPILRRYEPPRATKAGTFQHSTGLWNGTELEPTELWVHIPQAVLNDQDTKVPLILYSHGTGGDGRSGPGLWSRVANMLPAIVVAASESGPNEGYRYSERETQIALSTLRWALRSLPVDPQRVILTGVSRGGHQSWDLAARFPDRWSGIAPMIGGPRVNPAEGQNNFRYLENLAHLSIRDLQGLRDDPRLIRNLDLAFGILEELEAPDTTFVTFEEHGHSFDFGAVDWVEWIGSLRRDPLPREIVRRAARLGEGRTAWLEITKVDRKVQDEVKLRVPAKEWETLDDLGRARYVIDYVTERTARAEARLVAPGEIEVRTEQVERLELLLTPEMIDADGKVRVTVNGKARRRKVETDVQALLTDFCERLDPRFLPVARMQFRPR